MLVRIWRKRKSFLQNVQFWQECKLIKLLKRTEWSFLSKLKIELPYDLAISLPELYLKKLNHYLKKISAAVFTAEYLQ